MITQLITMNGYGIFVWLSFALTAIACLAVFLKTRKTLRKYEQEFLVELQALTLEEQNKALENSKVAQQVLTASFNKN